MWELLRLRAAGGGAAAGPVPRGGVGVGVTAVSSVRGAAPRLNASRGRRGAARSGRHCPRSAGCVSGGRPARHGTARRGSARLGGARGLRAGRGEPGGCLAEGQKLMFNAVVTCPSASSAGVFSECLEQEMPVQVAWSSVKFNRFPAFAVARVALRVQVGGWLHANRSASGAPSVPCFDFQCKYVKRSFLEVMRLVFLARVFLFPK